MCVLNSLRRVRPILSTDSSFYKKPSASSITLSQKKTSAEVFFLLPKVRLFLERLYSVLKVGANILPLVEWTLDALDRKCYVVLVLEDANQYIWALLAAIVYKL